MEKAGSNALRVGAERTMNVQELATMKIYDYTCTRCVFSSQVAPTKLQIKFCLLIILSQNF
jgi:hypothetical protein